MRFVNSLAMALALSLPTTTAMAVAGERKLPVPADKGWQHAASGIVLPASLAGLPRTSLIDLSDDERDMVIEFSDANALTVATVYIFHPGMMSVPVWFDRTQTVGGLRDIYHGLTPASAQPTAFAPPGAGVASGLRQIYTPGGGDLRATGIAVAQVSDWLVVVRLSSRTMIPAAADQRMSDVIAAIRWPGTVTAAPAAVPVAPCPDRLKTRKAKIIQPTMAQALFGAALISAGFVITSSGALTRSKIAPRLTANGSCRWPTKTRALVLQPGSLTSWMWRAA